MLPPRLILLATIASALPSTHLRAPAPGEQSCHVKQQSTGLLFKIDVGAPYDSGKGCPGIYSHIVQMVEDHGFAWPGSLGGSHEIYRWECEQGGRDENLDYTKLRVEFDWPRLPFHPKDGVGTWMNEVLGEVYPGINGFNCPNW